MHVNDATRYGRPYDKTIIHSYRSTSTEAVTHSKWKVVLTIWSPHLPSNQQPLSNSTRGASASSVFRIYLFVASSRISHTVALACQSAGVSHPPCAEVAAHTSSMVVLVCAGSACQIVRSSTASRALIVARISACAALPAKTFRPIYLRGRVHESITWKSESINIRPLFKSFSYFYSWTKSILIFKKKKKVNKYACHPFVVLLLRWMSERRSFQEVTESRDWDLRSILVHLLAEHYCNEQLIGTVQVHPLFRVTLHIEQAPRLPAIQRRRPCRSDSRVLWARPHRRPSCAADYQLPLAVDQHSFGGEDLGSYLLRRACSVLSHHHAMVRAILFIILNT